MDTLGTPAQTTVYKRFLGGLQEAFVVKASNSVALMQAVKLDAAGTIVPLATADDFDALCIGYALMAGAAGELVTVQVRGRAIVYGQATAALDAGPVKVASTPTTTDATFQPAGTHLRFTTDTPTSAQCGWSLDQVSAADAAIRVLLK